MSLPVMVWVFNHSEEKLGRRLTLLCLAEHAHDDGSKAFPCVETIMERTRLSRRAVQTALRGLEDDGSIEHTGVTRSGTNIYRVVMERTDVPGAVEAGGGAATSGRGADSAPDPSGPSTNPPGAHELSAQTILGAYVDESRKLGVDPPDRVKGHIAREVKKLLDEGQDGLVVRKAVMLLVERRMNPSVLPSLILEAAAGPAVRRRTLEQRDGANLSGAVDAPTPLPPPPTEEEREEAMKRLREMGENIGRPIPEAKLGEDDPETIEEDESVEA